MVRNGAFPSRYVLPWQDREMAHRAYQGRCPGCGAEASSRSAWIAPLQIVVEFLCRCGTRFHDCRPLTHFGVGETLAQAVEGEPGANQLASGYFEDAHVGRFRRSVEAAEGATHCVDGAGLLVPALTWNVWHLIVDFLYMAYHHQLDGPARVLVLEPFGDIAGLALRDVATFEHTTVARLRAEFAYIGHRRTPCADADRLYSVFTAGYTHSLARDRRAFMDLLASTVRPCVHGFRPALFLTVRFATRRWLPLLANVAELVRLYTKAHPAGGLILHGTPRLDGFALTEEWQTLCTQPQVVPVLDEAPLVQAAWCASADVCLQGSGAALVWPALFAKPTVIMGYRHNILVEQAGVAEDTTVYLRARGLERDNPVSLSYHEPSPSQAMDAVDELLRRYPRGSSRP